MLKNNNNVTENLKNYAFLKIFFSNGCSILLNHHKSKHSGNINILSINKKNIGYVSNFLRHTAIQRNPRYNENRVYK